VIRRLRVTVAVATVVALLAAAGCTDDAISKAPTTPQAGVTSRHAMVGLLMPGPSTRNAMVRLIEHEQDQIERCMAHRGLKYHPTSAAALMARLPSPDGSPEIRRAVGYGLRPDAAASKNDEYARSLDANANQSYSEALYGTGTGVGRIQHFGMTIGYPLGGCLAAARRAAYGSLHNYEQMVLLAQIYRSRASRTVEASPA
jgi:hypothetical protein